MPEWVLYYVAATVIIGALCQAVAAVLLLVAVGRGAAAAIRRTPGRQDVGPDPRTGFVWRACDSTTCAHLQTEHDVLAPNRLMCRRCDRVVTTTA